MSIDSVNDIKSPDINNDGAIDIKDIHDLYAFLDGVNENNRQAISEQIALVFMEDSIMNGETSFLSLINVLIPEVQKRDEQFKKVFNFFVQTVKDVNRRQDAYFASVGLTRDQYKKLRIEHREQFAFYTKNNVPFEYATELIKNNFPIELLQGKGNLLNEETIIYLVSLVNRKRITPEKIIAYFEVFGGEKLKDPNHNTHIYIEKLDKLLDGNIDILKKYVQEHNTNIIDTSIYFQSKPNIENKITQIDVYKKEAQGKLDWFEDTDIYTFFIGNKIAIDKLLPFLDAFQQFTIEDIAFLANEKNWESTKIPFDKRIQVVQNYLYINPKFTGEDIMRLLDGGMILESGREDFLQNKEALRYYCFAFPGAGWNSLLSIMRNHSQKSDTGQRSFLLPEENRLSDIGVYRKGFGEKINPFSVLNLRFFESKGGNIRTLQNTIEKLKSTIPEMKYTIDECIYILTKEGFSFEDIIKNHSFQKFTSHQMRRADFTGVKIEEYLTIRRQVYGEDKKLLSLDAFIDLKVNGMQTEAISEIWKSYLNKITLNEKEAQDQFQQNIGEFNKPGIDGLTDFLKKNQDKKITLGKTEFPIYGNLQLLHGALSYFHENLLSTLPESDQKKILNNLQNINWDKIIGEYEKSLNEYLGVKKDIDTVFTLFANHYHGEDYGNRMTKDRPIVQGTFPKSEFHDYSTGTELGNTLKNSNEFMQKLETYLKENPSKNVLVYVELHGDVAGNGWTSKGHITKEGFTKIQELLKKYTNFKMTLDSCNNAYKFGSKFLEGEIVSNSGTFYSVSDYGNFLDEARTKGEDGFQRGDLDKDGVLTSREIDLYVNTRYQNGIVTFGSAFKGKNGVIRLTLEDMLYSK